MIVILHSYLSSTHKKIKPPCNPSEFAPVIPPAGSCASHPGVAERLWTPGGDLFSLKVKKCLQTSPPKGGQNRELGEEAARPHESHFCKTQQQTSGVVISEAPERSKVSRLPRSGSNRHQLCVSFLLHNYTSCPDLESWLRYSKGHLLLTCLPISAQRTHPNLEEREKT